MVVQLHLAILWGTSGARIMGHLVHELRRTGGTFAIGSACIGGGQGMALVIENIQ